MFEHLPIPKPISIFHFRFSLKQKKKENQNTNNRNAIHSETKFWILRIITFWTILDISRHILQYLFIRNVSRLLKGFMAIVRKKER